MSNNVNHPDHYTQGVIECIDAINAATVGKKGIEAVCVANVIKYLWRYEQKGGLEDIQKAKWYLDKLISEVQGRGGDIRVVREKPSYIPPPIIEFPFNYSPYYLNNKPPELTCSKQESQVSLCSQNQRDTSTSSSTTDEARW